MANSDKEFRLRITGDARELGQSTKTAAASLNELKKEAMGLGSALTGGLVGGGIAGAVSFAVDKIRAVIQEARDLARTAQELNINPESAKYNRNLSKIMGVEEGTVNNAVGNLRQARSDALAGSPEAVRAFEDLGLSLEKIKNMEPDQMFQELAQNMTGRGDNRSREAFRRLVGEREGGAIDEFAVGGFFGNRQVIDLAGSSGKMAASEFTSAVKAIGTGQFGDLGRNTELENFRGQFKTDLEPLANYGRSQDVEGRRLANAEAYNKALRDQLPVQERILALRKEIADADQRILGMANTPLRQQEISRQAARMSELNQLTTSTAPSGGNGPTSQIAMNPSDQFTRVGRYFFGAGNATNDIPKQSLETLRKVQTLLEKSDANAIGRAVAESL